MAQHYSDPTRENDTYSLPDVETFYILAGEQQDEDGNDYEEGWYYQICFPGCLPDSDPFGPFDTEDEAIADMREQFGE